MGDRLIERYTVSAVLVIPFSAGKNAGFFRGKMMQRKDLVLPSSLYSNVICLTEMGRCTRCWVWRQLSNPTGLWGLSWSPLDGNVSKRLVCLQCGVAGLFP